MPVVSLPRGAGKARVIAGEYRGAKGPAKTFTPINVWDLSLKADTDLKLDLPPGHTAMIVVLTGHVTIEGSLGAREAEMVLVGREVSDVEVNADRPEEHKAELQSLIRNPHTVIRLKIKHTSTVI